MTGIFTRFDKSDFAGYDEITMTVICHISGAGRWLLRLIPALMLILLPATLLGCQSSIEVIPPTLPTVQPVVTAIPSPHAVAIIGVDFDPELDYSQILTNGGVTLLVAVENKGLSAESNVEVKARLLDTADEVRSRELLNQTVVIETLSPGQVRVVRFAQVNDLPLQERYELVVELSPVPGELELHDNTRRFDILVRAGS